MNEPEGGVLDNRSAENALRAGLAGNDPSAVELIWDRYADDLLAYLQAMLCSLHDAEDVLQTVFVRTVQKRHRLAKARCLDAYVYRIARNEAVRFINRRRKNKSAAPVDPSWLVMPESNRESSDLAERLHKALARLPQTQREVIVMKIYRQKTFLEISHLLGLSQNTVASRYRYGMERLRTLLESAI